jgi:hypothetical protein
MQPAAPVDATLPPPTSGHDLAQVELVVRTMAGTRDASGLAAFVNALAPMVLVDLVLAGMRHLPPRWSLPPDNQPLEPWVDQLLGVLGGQALPAHAVLPLQQPVPLPAHVGMPGAAGPCGAPPHAAWQPGSQPQQLQPAVQAAEAPTLRAAVGRAPSLAPPPKPAAKPPAASASLSFALEPTLMTGEQQSALRRATVLRVLRTKHLAAGELRATLAGRLLALLEDSDGATGGALQYLMEVCRLATCCWRRHECTRGLGLSRLLQQTSWPSLTLPGSRSPLAHAAGLC